MKDLTKKDIKNIVKDSNKKLFKERFGYPYSGDEITAAHKEKLRGYEEFINGPLNSLKNMVTKCNSEHETGNLSDADIDFLIDDQLGRLQTAVGFAVSSLMAIKEKGGLQLEPAGPQFSPMLEEESV